MIKYDLIVTTWSLTKSNFFQVNLFSTIKCVAQFVGGGIIPWYRIESFALFTQANFAGIMVQISQVLFGVTTFYYTINLISAYKKEGSQAFWANKWNWADIMTVLLSIFASTLYLLLTFVLVADMKHRVSKHVVNTKLIFIVSFLSFATLLSN